MALGEEIPDWVKRCPSGKQKFSSVKAAKSFLKSSRQGKARGPVKGTPHVYKCPECDAYHFTSAARRRDGKKF